MLPIGPTGYGDSPYQPFSSFAGDPLLIDLDELAENGYLARSSVTEADYGADPTFVDYDKIRGVKMALLKEAFAGFTDDVGYTSFVMDEGDWLDDYALFAALKERFGNRPWTEWEESIKLRKPEAVKQYTDELQNEIKFHKFVQYIFWRQWDRFHRYCNKNGIQVIGDIPIYVSPDCADVWAHPELFELDERLNPRRVAGVPPDLFSSTGQLWGNPLYNWEEMHRTGYKWWLQRIGKSKENYDMLRIDHFRAFDTYYAIPFGHKTAENGVWEKGPGMELFNAIRNDLGDVNIIAEDLGDIFDSVRELLRNTGIPGNEGAPVRVQSREQGQRASAAQLPRELLRIHRDSRQYAGHAVVPRGGPGVQGDGEALPPHGAVREIQQQLYPRGVCKPGAAGGDSHAGYTGTWQGEPHERSLHRWRKLALAHAPGKDHRQARRKAEGAGGNLFQMTTRT